MKQKTSKKVGGLGPDWDLLKNCVIGSQQLKEKCDHSEVEYEDFQFRVFCFCKKCGKGIAQEKQ